MENPRHGDKWQCSKCRTWCAADVTKRCSWCGNPRPAPVQPPKQDEKQ